jgi:hypothetical protein
VEEATRDQDVERVADVSSGLREGQLVGGEDLTKAALARGDLSPHKKI